MNTRKLWWLVPVPVAFAACFAAAQTTEPLIKHQFQNDDNGGWTAMGASAKVSVTHDASVVEAGKGALKFDYNVAKGEINVIVLPATVGTLAKAQSIKFQVRTDADTILVAALQEQDGGRYLTLLSAPKGKWQQVELSTKDFILAQEKDDPKDPDGKLDMDQVNSIAIGDFTQFFMQGDNTMLADLFGVKGGAHSLYVDDFTVSTDEAPTSFKTDAGTVEIDTFAHPQLGWLSLGGMKVAKSSGKPLDGAALRVDYHQSPTKFSAISRSIAPGLLKSAETLTFDAAATQATKLVVQVEETDGGKYNAMVDIPAGSDVQHESLKFADFKPADDSKDTNDKLDMDKVKSLVIVDITGMATQADQDNTLWINHIEAK